MKGSPRSTYRLALLAVGLSALLVTAGCAGSLGELGANDASAGSAELGSVPASAEYVGYVDAAGMADDEALRSIANTAMEARNAEQNSTDEPTDVDAMFEEAESDSGLDPEKVEEVTAFGTAADDPMAESGASAMILSASYTEDELVSAMDSSDAEVTEGTYSNTTVYDYESDADYQNAESVVAVLGDGEFALGDRSAVESVIDVRAGDAEALDGDLKTTFENTDGDSYVRMAMATPTDRLADEEAADSAPLDMSALNTVEYVSMAFGTGNGNVTTTLNMVAASDSDAEQTYELVDGAVSLYAGMGSEELQDGLGAISVEQNGDTVTVTHSDTVENIESLVEKMYDSEMGMGGGADSSYGSESNSAAVSPVTAPLT